MTTGVSEPSAAEAPDDPIDALVATDDPGAGAPPPTAVSGRPRWHPRGGRLGIQSKLLLMLLATSILSCLVVGVVGYRSGRDALRENAFDQLTFIRNSRARGITREFNRLVNQLIIFTRGETSVEAIRAFVDGFHELEDEGDTLTAEQSAALESYYLDTFLPALEANTGATTVPDLFLPTNPAQRYLQTWYTAPHADFDEAIAVDDAGDGSAWSRAHVEYHPFFRDVVQRFNYEDALLIDLDGDVVYSAYKGVDLGTNVRDGPFNTSSLRTAFEDAVGFNAVDFAEVVDLERYQPSYNVPGGWAVSPIGDNEEVYGVLALQIPLTNINNVMTGNQDWVDDGLGESGETYLVGRDRLMRSTSRLVVEDPEAYEQAAISGGSSPEDAARAARVGGTVLIQEVDTEQVARAQRGETGELIGEDYFGNEVLAAYMPIELGDLGWVVIAEIDASEAFAGVDDFTRRIVLSTAAILVAVTLASMLLAQVFSRPVKRLLAGVHRVAAGDLGAQVKSSSTDEFADLAGAFNDMSRSLQTKQELLEAEQREHERLLLTMMPESVAQRYRQGEETISQDHHDVAVVFADIVGFDEHASRLDSATALAQLNDIVRQFDEAAERVGVERVRTLRNGYLASCGLIAPRVDNALRAIDFTKEMDGVVQRFNAAHGTRLSLRAGVDAGSVTSGLVGRASVLYDLWGDAVNLASRVQSAGAGAGIYVSARVYDRLRDTMTFEQAGAVETSAGSEPVWRLAATP